MFNPSEDAKKIDVSYNNVDEIINRLKHQLKKCTNRSKSTKNIDVSSLQEMVVDNNDIRILVTKLYTSPKKNEKYATLPLEDFLEILKEWYELKKKYEETRKT